MVGKLKKASRTVEMKEGSVYVEQPIRTEWIPAVTPDCLKVETLLRINDMPYEHVDHEPLAHIGNSPVPNCKVAGKEITYSPSMMIEVAKALNKDYAETDDVDGVQRAFEALVEGSLYWVLTYMRATQANQLPAYDGFQGRFSQFLRPFANKVVANKLKTKADHQGIGRQNVQDVIAAGKQDLKAISKYLGQREYMNGEKPNKLDATTFAHLCQFWYIPTENELKTYMKDECANLVDYLERMKNKFWPDWTEKCRQPPPPRRTKSKDESSEKKTEEQVKEGETEQKTEKNGPPATESTTTDATTTTATPIVTEVTINGKMDPAAALNGNKDEPIVIEKVETVQVVTVVQENKPEAVENGTEMKETMEKA